MNYNIIHILSNAITTFSNKYQRLKRKNSKLSESCSNDVTNDEVSYLSAKIGNLVKTIISDKPCNRYGNKLMKLKESKVMMDENILEVNSHNDLKFGFINKYRKEKCLGSNILKAMDLSSDTLSLSSM